MPTPLQTHTYIAGIYNNTSVSGLTVLVDSNRQLGAVASSERFKTGIAPMGSNTTKLEQLRPVTYHLKTDPQGALRYGLIAEEVPKQQMAEMKALSQAMQIALQKLQSKDKLVAQR